MAVVAAAVLASVIVRKGRVLLHSGPRDGRRRFSGSDKAVLLELAGHRCEHHGLLGGRCRGVDQLEADHVHPWSRGGWTHVSNGQILCRRHNRAKSASIPWDRSLRRLAERRAAYYPQDAPCFVVRRQARASR